MHLRRALSPSTPVLLLVCLGGGTLAFLALISRVYGFWLLSRWPRLLLLGLGAGVCSLLLGLVLWAVWAKLAVSPRAGKLVWLGAAFSAGILLLSAAPPLAIPLLHVLEIQTPGTTAKSSGPVVLMELRDITGKAVSPVELRKEGSWQIIKEGLLLQSSQPASLRYSFYAPSQGKIQLLFGEQPDGGQVQLVLNGQSQQVDLRGAARGQRLVDLPFQKQSRWTQLIFLADLVLMGFVFPLFLFMVPFIAINSARWTIPRLRFRWGGAALQSAITQVYPKIFITVFIGICLLPFIGFRGDLSTINQFFGLNNVFWNLYTRTRQQIFQDRFIGNALIGKDGWLTITSGFSMEDYQNTTPLTEEELFLIQQRIDGTTRYLNEKGITFLVVITPNKNTIYPDRVPAQIQVIGKQSRLDQLLEYQRLYGTAQILDLRPALREARKDHEVYYHTDTHWNHYGAHAAYKAIIHALKKDFPGLTPHDLDDFRYVPTEMAIGDIGFRWVPGVPQEQYFKLSPLFERRVTKLEMNADRILYSYKYNQNNAGQPTAVIYHDSFMELLEPYLMDHFSKAVFSRALDMDKGIDERLIENEKPDIVIYEITERLLNGLLFLPGHGPNGE